MTFLDVFRHPLNRVRRALRSRDDERRSVFDAIFRANVWGDAESVSGSGSNLDQTRVVRRELPSLLRRWNVRRIVDAPCGDYHWMSQTALEVDSYIGIDLVPELIARNQSCFGTSVVRFQQGDLVRSLLPSADLVFCRDCLVHLSFADARAAIRNMKASGARFLLTTTFTRGDANADVSNGGWRTLNLQLAPFDFPPPLELLIEECTEWDGAYADKALGLWRFNDLPL
jgi:hypothetical protein